MSQCVPTWNSSDQHPNMTNVPSSLHHLISGSVSENLVKSKNNVQVAELRWKNGKPQLGTLESIIDQATAGNSGGAAHQPSFVSWLTGVDATVHCSDVQNLASRAGSCSGDGEVRGRKKARRWSCVNEEEEEEEEDTCDLYGTTSSPEGVWEEGGGSPETENTSSGYHEYSLPQSRRSLQRVGRVRAEEKGKKKMKKNKVMGSRAADVHNQSERKRRDRINQKMRTLQKLVPNSTKTDKASILDEVIDYLKQLQNQVKSMSSFPQMMMPLAMPHLQMAQMAQMAQMGLGHGFMDLGFFSRPGAMATPLPPLHHPPAFMPFVAAGERMPTTGGNSVSPDAFFAFSQQSMNMDAYNKMVAMYQQLHQQPPKPNI